MVQFSHTDIKPESTQNTPVLQRFRVIENPGVDLRRQLVELINLSGHVPYRVTHKKIYQAPYVVVVLNNNSELIAGCSIKSIQREAAEIGHLVVAKSYRRQGIGQAITQKRLEVARANGFKLLYAMVRDYNVQSRHNLEKAGFMFQRRYYCQIDTGSRLDCFIKPLQPISFLAQQRLLQHALGSKVAAIY